MKHFLLPIFFFIGFISLAKTYTLQIKVVNQFEEVVPNAKVQFIRKDKLLDEGTTDTKGEIVFTSSKKVKEFDVVILCEGYKNKSAYFFKEKKTNICKTIELLFSDNTRINEKVDEEITKMLAESPYPRIADIPEDFKCSERQNTDTEATFWNGAVGMRMFIFNSLEYPKESIENGEEGKVYLSFVIERNGEITNITVEKSVSKSLDNEAIRLIRSMPKWIPGSCGGVLARTRVRLPVSFTIN